MVLVDGLTQLHLFQMLIYGVVVQQVISGVEILVMLELEILIHLKN